jgi:hypothetical protein
LLTALFDFFESSTCRFWCKLFTNFAFLYICVVVGDRLEFSLIFSIIIGLCFVNLYWVLGYFDGQAATEKAIFSYLKGPSHDHRS